MRDLTLGNVPIYSFLVTTRLKTNKQGLGTHVLKKEENIWVHALKYLLYTLSI